MGQSREWWWTLSYCGADEDHEHAHAAPVDDWPVVHVALAYLAHGIFPTICDATAIICDALRMPMDGEDGNR